MNLFQSVCTQLKNVPADARLISLQLIDDGPHACDVLCVEGMFNTGDMVKGLVRLDGRVLDRSVRNQIALEISVNVLLARMQNEMEESTARLFEIVARDLKERSETAHPLEAIVVRDPDELHRAAGPAMWRRLCVRLLSAAVRALERMRPDPTARRGA